MKVIDFRPSTLILLPDSTVVYSTTMEGESSGSSISAHENKLKEIYKVDKVTFNESATVERNFLADVSVKGDLLVFKTKSDGAYSREVFMVFNLG